MLCRWTYQVASSPVGVIYRYVIVKMLTSFHLPYTLAFIRQYTGIALSRMDASGYV
jgi:hypothetical protein